MTPNKKATLHQLKVQIILMPEKQRLVWKLQKTIATDLKLDLKLAARTIIYTSFMLHFIIIKVFFEYFITKYGAKFLQDVIIFHVPSQPAFTCSKLTIEALEQIMKFVQS